MRGRITSKKQREGFWELKDGFEWLPFSWPLLDARGKVEVRFRECLTREQREEVERNPFSRLTASIEKWIELEKRYGDGYYEERFELLETVLDGLRNEQVDFEAVLNVLEEAKRAKRRHWASIRKLDARREYYDEWKIAIKQAKPALVRLRSALRKISTPHPPPPGLVQEPPVWRDLQKVEELLNSELFTKPQIPPGRLRLPKVGHQPEPWLEVAHKELRKAGVIRRADRQDLLIGSALAFWRMTRAED